MESAINLFGFSKQIVVYANVKQLVLHRNKRAFVWNETGNLQKRQFVWIAVYML